MDLEIERFLESVVEYVRYKSGNQYSNKMFEKHPRNCIGNQKVRSWGASAVPQPIPRVRVIGQRKHDLSRLWDERNSCSGECRGCERAGHTC